MAKRSNHDRKGKPCKPYAGYPLFLHASGRWAKKIKGRLHYFGRWGRMVDGVLTPVDTYRESADDALALYEAQRHDLQRGRKPRVATLGDGDGPTIKYTLDAYLTRQQDRVKAGEVKLKTFADYERTAKLVADTFGRSRPAADLDAEDFRKLLAVFRDGRNPTSVSNEIRRTRTMFKWATEAGVIEKRPRFGPDFKQASAKVLRRVREDRGELMFSAAQIHKLLAKSHVHLRAMIMLGLNAGLGQTDLSEMRLHHVDLDAGVLKYPRPKTGVRRRAILWTETVRALRASLAKRRDPKGDTPGDTFFVTKHGNAYVRYTANGSNIDGVSLEFGKVLRATKLKRDGLQFYSLRRTFETIASETLDQSAVDLVMGHADNSMGARYRQRIGDDRIKAACWHVRAWWMKGKRQGTRKAGAKR